MPPKVDCSAAAASSAAGVPAGAAASPRSLDCPSCFEAFEPVEGPRYPRILAPCAHTFCTECIERQIAACGANFRCLLHNSAVVGVVKATDAKANFALIELLELVKNDVDHQQVDDRASSTPCSECNQPATWYCHNDEACFCDEHKASEHAAKSRASHRVVPIAERFVSDIPKCPTHKTKDLDMWCTQCESLCCYMCAQFGEHKAHQDKLAPVESVAAERREKIVALMGSAEKLSSTEMDPASAALINLRNAFESSVEGTARAIDKLSASVSKAIVARAQELHGEARGQGAVGLKNLQLRIDDLTACRSQASAAAEEAKRVLRMNDHAVLKHSGSVEQSTKRSEQSWAAFKANSSEPQPMQFLVQPEQLQDEIPVAGKVFVPVRHVKEGVEMPIESESVRLVHRAAFQEQHAQLQSLQAQLQASKDVSQSLRVQCAEAEAKLQQRDVEESKLRATLKDKEATQLRELESKWRASQAEMKAQLKQRDDEYKQSRAELKSLEEQLRYAKADNALRVGMEQEQKNALRHKDSKLARVGALLKCSRCATALNKYNWKAQCNNSFQTHQYQYDLKAILDIMAD